VLTLSSAHLKHAIHDLQADRLHGHQRQQCQVKYVSAV